ncbi:MAG: adenylate/guanylate cyclase domain-containing protein [Planctomycetia bacterium]|nr:adenylate/guanylate cyclase domain-containing protein [Planctomycetia bacterium]
MPDLIAEGLLPHQRWRRPLHAGETFALGRTAGPWSIPWDQQISGEHAQVSWEGLELVVVRLPSGRNPVFFHGQETDRFSVRPGEHFVIGGTRFTLSVDQSRAIVDVPRPLEEQSYSSQALKDVRFRDAAQRLEVLSRLPEVISGAASDHELFVRLVNMVLVGIPSASAVALVVAEGAATDEPAPPLQATPRSDAECPVRVLHWDQRFVTTSEFQPSRRLIVQAIRTRQSVLHVWRAGHDPRGAQFTVAENLDWAFCTPVPGTACRGWGIYVAGRFPSEQGRPGSADLREDPKFAEIVASTLASLRQLSQLQRQQATMAQFFPPAVLRALQNRPAEQVLAPCQTHVSVLFCDLRGFSRKVESDAGDLMGLLQRVSKALGVMTRAILDHGGVVGDFHGDAAMGFWGWPPPQEDDAATASSLAPDRIAAATARPACLAALAIRQEFEAASRLPGHPLAGFRAGIGVATGPAVAGGIGTSDQVKFTVFGHVVNTASRLEGMTKLLHAPILVDQPTSEAVRGILPAKLARFRDVAKVCPYGMANPVLVTELLPPAGEGSELSDADVKNYETALAHFVNQQWKEAYALLQQVSPNDEVKDFLINFIIENRRQPPANWDGSVVLHSRE